MNISQLIEVLQTELAIHGDLEVMVEDRECNQLPTSTAMVHVAKDGEFPEDWKMPGGFTFLQIVVD